MNDYEQITEPGILTSIAWFFWRNWNRAVCAVRGHDISNTYICERCGLPVPTWEEITELREALERMEREALDV